MYKILEKINSPKDVKKLSMQELKALASDIRNALFNRLTKIGGHCAPNFGVVEIEIAMHYVFNSPKDKFVFDVSHQTYPHKMLTGRKNGYILDECFAEDSGYSNPNESEHDLFTMGHTSTSISLATGLAKAEELAGTKNNIVALIGDGSLSGGEALEGLNVSGSEIHSNLIIIVNDNQQSISETHGGIYKNLSELRKTNGKAECNIFKAMGLDYIYENNGNDIPSLIKVLEKVKDSNHPIVLHINTLKGKGFSFAEQNKEAWHFTAPFNKETGERLQNPNLTHPQIAKEFILNKAKTDKDFVVITPNMPSSIGLTPADRIALGKQFVDVGIAEEQAIAMASGLAKGGANPLVVTNTTFLQRAYDQISHDTCINNSPITILLNYSSFSGLTDVTHLGIFGLSIFTNIPNLWVFAPTSKEELETALDYSTNQKDHPVMILLPEGEVIYRTSDKNIDFSCGKYSVNRQGEKVGVIALGNFYNFGIELCEEIEKQLTISPTLINPHNASVLDTSTLENLKQNHKLIITLEDGILDGGFGQKIANYFSASDILVKTYGLNKEFYDRYNPAELLEMLGVTKENIIQDIENILK